MADRKYSQQDLIQHATLTEKDIDQIKRCRRSHNRIGFAYQIGFVRLKNRFPTQQPLEIALDLANYAGVQLNIEPDEIYRYALRQQTISEHQIRIRQYLDLKELVHTGITSLEKYIFQQSCRLEQTAALYSLVEQYLRDNKILQPADSTLQRMIGEQRELARQHIYEKIADSLPKGTQQKFDSLLEVGETAFSPLQQLKAVPRTPSPSALLELIHKLEQIAFTGVLYVDLSWLNENYQRILSNYVQGSSAYTLRDRITPLHRYAAVTCFLWQTYRDTIDQIVDMYDKLINKVHNWAQDDLDEAIKRKRKSIQRVLAMFAAIGEVLLDKDTSDDCVRDILFSKFTQEELAERLEQSKEWTSGKNSHIFHGVMGRFSYLRQFSKGFLEHLEFESCQRGSSQAKLTSLLDSIKILQEMNQSGKRKLPPEAPIAFVPDRLRSFVENDGELDKCAWECALLTVLRDEIKSGNLSVAYSKRFRNFDDFFIPTSQWQKARESFFGSAGLPWNPQEACIYLTERLDQAYDSFLESQPSNTYARVENNGWRLSTDPTEKLEPQEEDNLKQLKSWLKKKMRSIRLPELLIEVDNELNYTQHFMPIVSMT